MKESRVRERETLERELFVSVPCVRVWFNIKLGIGK